MLEIGQIVDGKYKILNVIGKGGMSVVYLAMNEKAGKQWAIKEVRKDGKQDFNVVKQGLVAELGMLKRLSHPNLPSIIDVIDGEDTFLIVMDYIEGISLEQKLKESGAQQQQDVIKWAKELCDVLGYLHSRRPPIIYRDMKPANVMLKPDGSVTLIDFGTAREFKDTSVEDTTCLGTRGYAAPEQFGGHGQTDARTDIYCLGATMYHLITGHNPSAPPYEMYPIRQWNSLLSPALEEIILICTQQNPAARFQSCAELMVALDDIPNRDGGVMEKQRLKWRLFLSSVIISVVMCAGAVTFGLLEKKVTSETYEGYISNAQKYVDDGDADKAFENFKNAIELEPGNAKAYKAMINYAMSDDKFTIDEYDNIYTIMKEYETSFKNENILEYADFCFYIGINCFEYYGKNEDGEYVEDKTEGEDKSSVWFKKAKDAFEKVKEDEGDDKLQDYVDSSGYTYNDDYNFAEAFYDYMTLDGQGKGNTVREDPNNSYKAIFDIMTELVDKDLYKILDDKDLVLEIYDSFANRIYNNAPDFSSDENVTYDDMKELLNTMESKAEELNASDEDLNNLKEDISRARSEIEMCEAGVQTETVDSDA